MKLRRIFGTPLGAFFFYVNIYIGKLYKDNLDLRMSQSYNEFENHFHIQIGADYMDNKRQGYRTRQRDLILLCLKQSGSNHISADIIMEFMKERGESVGLTTIYRNLERLVNEGELIKYDAPDGKRACYQYAGCDRSHDRHYHLVCNDCGRLSHLCCESLDGLFSHMKEEHRFEPDISKTVLYGRCGVCAERGK